MLYNIGVNLSTIFTGLPSELEIEVDVLTQDTREYFMQSTQSDFNTNRVLELRVTKEEIRRNCSKLTYANALSMKANPNKMFLVYVIRTLVFHD